MKINVIMRNFVLTIVILIFIYSYKISFSKQDYLKIYQNGAPNYKKNYNELKKNYELMLENYDFIPAEIINLSIKKVNNLFLVNKGSSDNVQNNSFIVNEDGLVGEIVKVYKNVSIVRLITSKYTNIPVEINNCFGTLRVKNNKYIVSDLINCSDVKKGDPVFTSKYNYSSSNILIGSINKINNNNLYIKYSFNPYKLRYVGIINDSH